MTPIDFLFYQRLPVINRLNSGIRNWHNFFLWSIFIYQKLVADPVSHANSGDIKVFVQFPLKLWLRFWNCVDCGHMRGCFIVQITRILNWFSLNPRNFKPRNISSVALCDDITLPQHLRKSSKMDFRFLVPRKLVRVCCYWEWFFKLYTRSFSDSLEQRSKKSRNSAYS